jgi:hypothetical protein
MSAPGACGRYRRGSVQQTPACHSCCCVATSRPVSDLGCRTLRGVRDCAARGVHVSRPHGENTCALRGQALLGLHSSTRGRCAATPDTHSPVQPGRPHAAVRRTAARGSAAAAARAGSRPPPRRRAPSRCGRRRPRRRTRARSAPAAPWPPGARRKTAGLLAPTLTLQHVSMACSAAGSRAERPRAALRNARSLPCMWVRTARARRSRACQALAARLREPRRAQAHAAAHMACSAGLPISGPTHLLLTARPLCVGRGSRGSWRAHECATRPSSSPRSADARHAHDVKCARGAGARGAARGAAPACTAGSPGRSARPCRTSPSPARGRAASAPQGKRTPAPCRSACRCGPAHRRCAGSMRAGLNGQY